MKYTTIDEIYPTHLKPADLHGKTVTVQIERIEFSDFPENPRNPSGPQQTCPVLYFAGKQKYLIINPDKAEQLAEATGSRRFKDFIGKRIRLSPAPGRSKGSMTIKIQEEEAPPAEAQPAPTPPPPGESRIKKRPNGNGSAPRRPGAYTMEQTNEELGLNNV